MQRNTLILAFALSTACQIGERQLGSIGEETQGSESGSEGADAVCGDGVVQPGETCDDANLDDLDDCHDDCTSAGQTLWRQEFPGRSVNHMALAHDRIWVAGTATLNHDDWMGAVDFGGELIEDEVREEMRIGFLAVVADDRVLWSQAIPPWVPNEICVRDIGQPEKCTKAMWGGEPVSLNATDAGFGRVAAFTRYHSTRTIYEIDTDGVVFRATTFIPDAHQSYYSLHAFAPTDQVMLHGYDEIAELSWLDDDAMPTQATQVAQIPPTTEHDVPEILEVAADGRVGVYVLASTEQGDEVPLMMVVDPDGKPRWSMRPQGSLVALVFSPDGDLFALEDHEDWEVALTRYSPEGEVRWTHTWDETGSNFAVMEGGPDGTLYLGGPAYPSSEGAPGVVMAIRP